MSKYFTDLILYDYIVKNNLDSLLNINLDDFNELTEKKQYGIYDLVDPTNKTPYAPELDDLARLHHIATTRKAITILEFGTGYSTLVLADALAYTEEKYKPEIMVDLATLTGACVVALGYYAAAIMGKDQELIENLRKAGENSGDRVWQLPFFEEYHDAMDGDISDLNNISQKGKGYEGGSITAGVFLSKFVNLDKTRWAHLDIAGSAYWSIKGDYLQRGATGSGVRVLSYYLLDN